MMDKQKNTEVVKTSKKAYLQGYALKFDVSYNMGWFMETVDRNALKDADMSDVRALVNHDVNQILGRTTAGTLKLGIDSVGLWYEVKLPESPTGQNIREALERGDITQSSWAFTLASDGGDSWQKPHGQKPIRTLTRVATLFDVSAVVYPANPSATAGIQLVDHTALRSADWKTKPVFNDVDAIFAAIDKQLADEALADQQRKAFAEFEPRFKAMAREMEQPLRF